MEALNQLHVQLLAGAFFRLVALAALTTLIAAELPAESVQLNNSAQKKVLALHLMRRDDTATLGNDRTYQKVLTEGLGRLDYYGEYLDLARFRAIDYQSAFRDFLKQKYKDTDFDLIIATTADMRNFLVRFGGELFPNTPVVYSKGGGDIDNSSLPSNFTGIVYETDLRGTLDIIGRLQPAVRRVFVVAGASAAVDKWHEARARNQFKKYEDRLQFTYWTGLPLNELKQRISNLTPDSAVYFLMMVEDGAGERFGQTAALDQIAAVSTVPIYTWHDSFLGHGVVGGKLASSERAASQTAQLGLRILRGEPVQKIPPVNADTSRLAFDWRELHRWKLSTDRLPPDAEVLFREASFWQRYRSQVLGVVALVIFQSALIIALLFERRRRRKANLRLREGEARYRNVVESQTELICRFLPDTTLTFVNDAYCKYFGKTASELIGTKFLLLIPQAERDLTLRHIQSLVAKRSCSETREHPVIRQDGIPAWHQWTSCVISTETDGRIELQGVGRDISERKQLEHKLMRSELEFSTLVENSPDVICRLNRDLRYTYVSPKLEAIFGIPTEVFLGKQPGEVSVSDYEWREFESKCREAIDTGQSTLDEFQYRGRHYRTRIIPEYSSNARVESVMSITEDITERLRVELELRKLTGRLMTLQDEERRRIARELHDGATQDISALAMNLRRMAQLPIQRTEEISGLISDSQQLATQSLTELRTLSYLLHPPILDQAGLAHALRWFVRGFSERTGIHIDVGAVDDIGRLPGDIETALFRIVQESLTNVHRHSGSDTAAIRLVKGGAEVKLQISDRGHGIAGAACNRPPGEEVQVGVGISGMRQRVAQLAGRLEIDSSESGTTITVVVPTIQGTPFSPNPAG